MMYTIEIAVEAAKPLTQRQLFAVAAIGGAAAGRSGEHRIETILTEECPDMIEAIARATTRFLALVPGRMIAIEAMTLEESDRRMGFTALVQREA